MHYLSVVDRVEIPTVLDPIAAAAFLALFVATVALAHRRPSVGAALLIFLVPFDFQRVISATTITSTKIVLVALVLTFLVKIRTYRQCSNLRSLAIAFGSVIVATLATAIVADFRNEVWHEALRWAEYALDALAVGWAYKLDRNPVLLRRAFGASIALVCASAIADEFIGSAFGIAFGSREVPRLSGALEGPNQLGGFLELAFAFAAAWAVKRDSTSLKFLLVFIGFVLPMTFSRATFAGILASFVVIAMYERFSISRVASFFFGVALGFANVELLLLRAQVPIWVAFLHPADFDSAAGGGVGNRRELWHAAWYFFRTHPLLGIGAGNFQFELPRAGVYGVRTHANSWYLQSLAEGGAVLFVATLAFLATVARETWSAARASAWGLAALAATVAMIVHGTLDYLVFYPKVAQAWFMLVALGIAARSEARTAIA